MGDKNNRPSSSKGMSVIPSFTSFPKDYTNNFSGVPTTPPLTDHHPFDSEQKTKPIFSVGVETHQNTAHKGPSSTLDMQQDVGGAHLTLKVSQSGATMSRSKSSPALSQFFQWSSASQNIGNSSHSEVEGKTLTKVKPDTNHVQSGAMDIPGTRPSYDVPGLSKSPKHLRKKMESYLSSGQQINKYGGIFRKPGLNHKVLDNSSAGVHAPKVHVPSKIPEDMSDVTSNSLQNKSLTGQVKDWLTKSTVKTTQKEIETFTPSSF